MVILNRHICGDKNGDHEIGAIEAVYTFAISIFTTLKTLAKPGGYVAFGERNPPILQKSVRLKMETESNDSV